LHDIDFKFGWHSIVCTVDAGVHDNPVFLDMPGISAEPYHRSIRRGRVLTKEQALQLQSAIESECKSNDGVWVNITHEKKPDLKTIKLEVSIKITE
jgi:hypothetical protein